MASHNFGRISLSLGLDQPCKKNDHLTDKRQKIDLKRTV